MKVVILKGSPRGRRSNSSKIADAFADGARAAMSHLYGVAVDEMFAIKKARTYASRSRVGRDDQRDDSYEGALFDLCMAMAWVIMILN